MKKSLLGSLVRGVFRNRSLFLFWGAAAVVAASFRSDPDGGMATILGGLAIAQGVWAIAAAHIARKALLDYPEANVQGLFAVARQHAIGAGLALIAVAIFFVGFLLVFAPRAHAGELPTGFSTYGPVLKAEQMRLWPQHPRPALLAGLVEQESCPSLTSKSCWNPSARLKTAREEGAGLGQITRAYRQDGSLRMDSLAGLRAHYGVELNEWSWSNVYARPDLQLRAIVLMSRDAVAAFPAGVPARLEFGDAAYNGGTRDVQNERRACALTPGCDPGQWFGNVEAHCVKSRQALYGNRSACDINRLHVHNVFLVRQWKYVAPMAAM